jgi:hypothetical protein
MTPTPKLADWVRVGTDHGLINGFVVCVRNRDLPLVHMGSGAVRTLTVMEEAVVSTSEGQFTIPARSWRYTPKGGGWVGTPPGAPTHH